MKKKILIMAIMIVALMSIFVISASAESKIIKLDTLPTLEEIHANPGAYISRVDGLEDETNYKSADPDSVIVLSDLAETPTYYVYPAYYLIRSTTYSIAANISNFNAKIAEADATAFAGYKSDGGTWGNGECDYLIRLEMPKYVTSIQAKYKFEGSSNIKEIYFPVHTVINDGVESIAPYCSSISGENLFGNCYELEVIHNMEYLSTGLVQGNNGGFYQCRKLKKFIIPEGVTSIPASFFYDCDELTELIMPNSVKSVGKMAFANCAKLQTINFGAGFTTFYSPNNDFETCLSSSNIKYVYLPDAEYKFLYNSGSESTKFYNIFNQAKNVTFFFTGSQANAQALKDKFTSSGSNANFTSATLVEYDPNVDYTTYATTNNTNVIVYNYNKCEAFYNGEHDYKGTGLCLDGVSCDMCKKSIPGTTEHNFNEAIEYANGYTQAGVYCKDCTNEGCTALDVTRAADALFSALAENGYSSNGTGIAFGGYTVNIEALAEFNTVNKNNTLTYGVVIMNPKYVGDSFFTDGSANATKGFVVADMSASEYSNIKVMIDGLGANKSLELVIALYAYTDGADVEFIQSEDTNSACSSVEKTDATLYTVSLISVVDKPNASVDALPPYENKENA